MRYVDIDLLQLPKLTRKQREKTLQQRERRLSQKD